ncbi:MAG: trypsin-like peptidase domain-containing protein [Chthoniobacterales bacterium]
MSRFVFILCLLVAGVARGVIVQGGDGSGNTTGAGAGIGWNYVGSRVASAVYLGNYNGGYWVLTAGHVGAGTLTLNGTDYFAVPGSEVTLTNADSTNADLKLFRIDADPGLANLSLASVTPTFGDAVTMIGFGSGREAAETHWDLSWQETAGPGIYRGYKWSEPHVERWAPNTAAGATDITYENGEKTSVFVTEFRTGTGQATNGDSGGGVFLSDGTLAGIMISVSNVSGQPGSTSIYSSLGRNDTYIADVSKYRSQILGIVSAVPIPEPRVPLLLGLAVLAALAVRSFKKAPAAPR